MMKSRRDLPRFILLLVLALVLLNLVGARFKFRWDLTSDHRYTLSPATNELLAALPEAVTVTAYFTGELPPEYTLTRQDFKDLLVEYAERSNGKVVFEFIDPNQKEETEQQALKDGIQPLLVNIRKKDKQEQLKAYMGAIVKMGEQVATIPVVQPGTAMEWALSSSIKQVSVVNKPTLGLVQGHGEPPMGAMAQAIQSLSVLYNVEPFTFWDTLPVHDRWDALVMIDPTDSIPQNHLGWLSEFMSRGKGVVMAYSAVQSDLGRSPLADARRSDLVDWLAARGVQVRPLIVTDAQCGQVSVMQQRGYFTMQTAIPFPYFPLITSFGDHPVASGLDGVIFQFASPLEFTGDTSAVKWAPLIMTSEKSNALPAPAYIDVQKQWSDADFPKGPQVLGAALEGVLTARGRPTRMVVFTNGSFAVGGQGHDMQQINPDNVNLLVNAVDWIGDDTGLIELRNKGVNYRPLDELADARRTLLKWMNLLLPVLLVVIYGVWRARWRRTQRRQRMEPGHVR